MRNRALAILWPFGRLVAVDAAPRHILGRPMEPKARSYLNIMAMVGIALMGLGIGVATADSLYIGDENDNTVKQFDAATGTYLGVFVTRNSCPVNPPSAPRPGCLYGPRGLVFNSQGHLLVADQNENLGVPGAIYEYYQSGTFLKALVPYTDPKAPPAPRGIVLFPTSPHPTLFVASLSGVATAGAPSPGQLQAFDGTTGAFRGPLDDAGLGSSFHPRGVVIGPHNLLYVSNDPVLGGIGGQILRYDPRTLAFIDVFVSCGGLCDFFNRPEGLVFGPDGNLYVTSFRASSSDTDKILIFAGPLNATATPGTLLAKIDLDQIGQQRAYAQALLFGPGGLLFVPISTPKVPDAGQVRRYNVTNNSFDIFVPSSSQQNSPLGSSQYLTFGKTNPATLAYPSTR
jgi:DNA-binding beta-propeller fold protein YncE